MKIVIFFFFLFFLNSLISFSQVKQTNKIGSDILAEAPWRMKKTDSSGNVNGIPLHVFIKDADDIGNNAELIYVNIYLKNAVDTLLEIQLILTPIPIVLFYHSFRQNHKLMLHWIFSRLMLVRRLRIVITPLCLQPMIVCGLMSVLMLM